MRIDPPLAEPAIVAAPPLQRASAPARLLPLLLIGIVVLGIALRLYAPAARVFWDDEVIATLHILGVTEGELVRRAPSLRTMGDLRAALHPGSPLRPAAATIGALVSEDPQHPPLYYLAARLWAGLAGDSRTALRLLSALIGLAALPAMFWLCWELFASQRAAWMGAALTAVSPVALVYAHEIREYGLWLTAILVLTAVFVRAVRRSNAIAWTTYGAALAAALYVFPATALVALAHLVTVLTVPNRRAQLRMLLATFAGTLAYVPWLLVIAGHHAQIEKGMATIVLAKSTPASVVHAFANLVQLDVLDFDAPGQLAVKLCGLPVLALLAYAVYALRDRRPPLVRTLIWTLLAFTSLPIVLLDVFLGGDRTGNVRYFLPVFVALDLALVALMMARIEDRVGARRSGVWGAVFSATFAARVLSCLLIARSTIWWSDYDNHTVALAPAVAVAPRPIVLADGFLVWTLSFAEYVDPRIPVVVRPRCYLCSEPAPAAIDPAAAVAAADAGRIVLIAPSPRLDAAARAFAESRTPHVPLLCIDVQNTCRDGRSLWRAAKVPIFSAPPDAARSV